MRGVFLPCLLTMAGGWKQKLGDLKRIAGVDVIFLMIVYLEDGCQYANPLCPWVMVGSWKPWEAVGVPGPDQAVPIPDLRLRNATFTTRLDEVLAVLKANEQAPAFMIADRGSEPTEGTWQEMLDVGYANVQQYPDWEHPERMVIIDPKTGAKSLKRQYSGGNQAEALYEFWDALDIDVWKACQRAGIIRAYAIPKNEGGYNYGPAYPKTRGVEWQAHRSAHLKETGFIVTGSWGWQLYASDVEPFSAKLDQHQVITAADLDSSQARPWPAKIIVNTDGKMGNGPIISAYGGRTIGDQQAYDLGVAMVQRGLTDWCITPQEMFVSKTGVTNADPIRTKPFEEISRATGLVCLQTERSRQSSRSDEARVEPEESCYEKYIAHRPIRKWQVGKFLKCILGNLW